MAQQPPITDDAAAAAHAAAVAPPSAAAPPGIEAELNYVRRQLSEERRVNDDLKRDRDRWLAEMESTLQQSRETLAAVQERNLLLQTEVEQHRVAPPVPYPQHADPALSPARIHDPAPADAPPVPASAFQPIPAPDPTRRGPILSPRPTSTAATTPQGKRTRPGALTSPVPSARKGRGGGGGGGLKARSPGGRGDTADSATTNVAKASWLRFSKLATDKFLPEELALVSLDTLKGLMKHYQIKDPIECARIEVYWRLLGIHREGGDADAPDAAASPSQSHPRGRQATTPRGRAKFVPVEHPRPFDTTVPARGPHLSRRNLLRSESPRVGNPNASQSRQHTLCSTSAVPHDKSSVRTYDQSVPAPADACCKRSRSLPSYRPTSNPSHTPSSFHAEGQTGLRTFADSPVAGKISTYHRAPSGRRPVCQMSSRDAGAVSPVRSLRIVPQVEKAAPKVEGLRTAYAEPRVAGIDVDMLTYVGTKGTATGKVRTGYSSHAPADPIIAPPPAAGGGLRVLAKPSAVSGDPNPRGAPEVTVEGKRVHDPTWCRTSHHHDPVPATIASHPAHIAYVPRAAHLSPVRHLHSFADLHGSAAAHAEAPPLPQAAEAAAPPPPAAEPGAARTPAHASVAERARDGGVVVPAHVQQQASGLHTHGVYGDPAGLCGEVSQRAPPAEPAPALPADSVAPLGTALAPAANGGGVAAAPAGKVLDAPVATPDSLPAAPPADVLPPAAEAVAHTPGDGAYTPRAGRTALPYAGLDSRRVQTTSASCARRVKVVGKAAPTTPRKKVPTKHAQVPRCATLAPGYSPAVVPRMSAAAPETAKAAARGGVVGAPRASSRGAARR